MEFMIFTIMNKYVDFLLVIEFALIIFTYTYHDVKKTNPKTTQLLMVSEFTTQEPRSPGACLTMLCHNSKIS